MKSQTQNAAAEKHAFCSICGRPFSEAERVLAAHTNNFQCHHCWRPVRNLKARTDSHYHAARSQGRVIPVSSKHRRS